MTYFGSIKSYDSGKGAGTIVPENGGDALPFKKADLQSENREPKVDQRYGYETSKVDSGKVRAVNLRHQEQAQDQEQDETRKKQAREQRG